MSGFKVVKAQVEKLGESHLEVTTIGAVNTVQLFTLQVKELQQMMRAQTKTWSRETYLKLVSDGVEIVKEAEQNAVKLEADAATLKSVRLLEVRALSGERRRMALAVRRLIKPLVAQNFWKAGQTWLGEKVLGVSVTVKDQIEPTTNLAKSKYAEVVDGHPTWSVPQHWSADSTAEAHSMLTLWLEILGPAVDALTKKLEKHLNDDPACYVNLARLPQGRAGEKGIRPDDYIPKNFLGEAASDISSSESFSTPMLLGMRQLGWRWGMEKMPFCGTGCFLRCTVGACSIVCWPMHSVLSKGASMSNVTEFFDGMSPSEFASFMTSEAAWVDLKTNESMWVPWGWYLTMVATSDVCLVFMEHWFSCEMLAHLPPEVAAEVVRSNCEYQESQPETPQSVQAVCWFKVAQSGNS